jgi:hypothetical protein
MAGLAPLLSTPPPGASVPATPPPVTATPLSGPPTPIPVEAALTQPAWPAAHVAPTRLAPPPAAPTAAPTITGAGRLGWPVLAAAAVLFMLLGLFVQSGRSTAGDEPPTNPSSTVAPVPAAPDPASSARNLADWLRDRAE